ncbi:MAG TPA: hypothetical protein VEJ42_10950, partial [Streptosporangiaceae bacterium]|nr:hypothetical protein [Streptosporangiaceae bacterium]
TLSYEIVVRFAGRLPKSYLGATQSMDPVLAGAFTDPGPLERAGAGDDGRGPGVAAVAGSAGVGGVPQLAREN